LSTAKAHGRKGFGGEDAAKGSASGGGEEGSRTRQLTRSRRPTQRSSSNHGTCPCGPVGGHDKNTTAIRRDTTKTWSQCKTRPHFLPRSPSPAPLVRHISLVEKQPVPSVWFPPEQPWVSGPPRRPGSFPPWFQLRRVSEDGKQGGHFPRSWLAHHLAPLPHFSRSWLAHCPSSIAPRPAPLPTSLSVDSRKASRKPNIVSQQHPLILPITARVPTRRPTRVVQGLRVELSPPRPLGITALRVFYPEHGRLTPQRSRGRGGDGGGCFGGRGDGGGGGGGFGGARGAGSGAADEGGSRGGRVGGEDAEKVSAVSWDQVDLSDCEHA
jgi:hypothetical protein